jgi:hypothetical protein
MSQEFNGMIILQAPVAGVAYALQKGKAAKHELVQIREASGADERFSVSFTIKPGKDGLPDFGGPFVQGPVEERFIYITIGTSAGQATSPWSRRLKIPLRSITWEMVQQLKDNPDAVLQTSVPGTGKDGTPNCATVKPFGGWVVATQP